MKKPDLIREMAIRTHCTQAQARAALETALDLIGNALRDGETVMLYEFGKFEARRRHGAKNPATGDPVIAPLNVKFTAASPLKKKINS